MIAKQIKKKNSKHAAITLHCLSYNHETSMTVVNKLITMMHKYFIACYCSA